MQNNNCKNQNERIPSLKGGAAKSGITFLPIHTCTEQSPVCLIKDHHGPCLHKNCLMAYKKPQWFGISIAEFYNQREFTHFDVMISDHERLSSYNHIIPRNPNPGSKDGFEGFRQSQNAVLYLNGQWPSDIKVVSRDHIEIRWAEYMEEYPYTDPVKNKTKWLQRLDVKEYAYYVGQPTGDKTIMIDVKVINTPTIGFTLINRNEN